MFVLSLQQRPAAVRTPKLGRFLGQQVEAIEEAFKATKSDPMDPKMPLKPVGVRVGSCQLGYISNKLLLRFSQLFWCISSWFRIFVIYRGLQRVMSWWYCHACRGGDSLGWWRWGECGLTQHSAVSGSAMGQNLRGSLGMERPHCKTIFLGRVSPTTNCIFSFRATSFPELQCTALHEGLVWQDQVVLRIEANWHPFTVHNRRSSLFELADLSRCCIDDESHLCFCFRILLSLACREEAKVDQHAALTSASANDLLSQRIETYRNNL